MKTTSKIPSFPPSGTGQRMISTMPLALESSEVCTGTMGAGMGSASCFFCFCFWGGGIQMYMYEYTNIHA